METSKIVNLLQSHKGQIFRACWRRKLRTKKDVAAKIEKITETSVRSGVNFDKMSRVQMKRETGDLPEKNQGLPFGEWVVQDILIRHKNQDYVRLYPTFSNVRPHIKYLMDGKETTLDKIKDLCLASETKERNEEFLCFTLKIDSLETLEVGKKFYRLK